MVCPADGVALLDREAAVEQQRARERERKIGITPDQVREGRYRVQRRVGEGGMSVVYLAIDTLTGERVAVKALSTALSGDPNAMARLRREARLGERLAHPCACGIRAIGETPDGLMYVLMPFLDGEVLCDRTARLRQIPLADAVPLVRDIAEGLHAAHSLGIIHRDLKPENVILCRRADDTGERAVVMDFGLAKQHRAGAEVEKLTATGVVLGTPEFMSPEQLRGKALDARTDIYSLAVMTYELLTGALPFPGRTKQDVMLARLQGEPSKLSASRPDIRFPNDVEGVLARGLARDRNRRYRSAPEFATALADAASNDRQASKGASTPWWKRALGMHG
jgi:serine/threonine-protein kinase